MDRLASIAKRDGRPADRDLTDSDRDPTDSDPTDSDLTDSDRDPTDSDLTDSDLTDSDLTDSDRDPTDSDLTDVDVAKDLVGNRIMTMSAGELAIWNGLPVRVFPYGSHVFPADLEAVRELGEVLREDLRREHRVAIELIARVQAGTQDSTLAGSLPLPRLCDFLLRRRPAFDRAAHRRIAENTLAQGRLRLEELRALNAPDVILDHTSAEIARVAEPGWSPSINPANLLPNVGATLSAIDLDDLSDEERTLYFDITTLVLLAAQCCTTFDAKALDDAPWLEELAWTRLVDEDEDVPAPPVDVVQFRGTVYSEHCQRLECAIVPADRTAQFGATALLAVSIPEPAE